MDDIVEKLDTCETVDLCGEEDATMANDLKYRPFDHDDWGIIRNADGTIYATVRRPEAFEGEFDQHRAEGTDPFADIARKIMCFSQLESENAALQSDIDRLGNLAKSLSAMLDEPDRHEAIIDVIADRDSWREQCSLRDADISRLTKERDEAWKVLDPFARYALAYEEAYDGMGYHPGDLEMVQPISGPFSIREIVSVSLADFRRAAALRQKADIPTSDDLPEGGCAT